MKRLYSLLCGLFFCGVCFADSWTINTIAYGIEGSASVAVDINNMPIVVSENYPQNLVLITQTPVGYDVNQIPDTLSGVSPSLKITSNGEFSLSFSKVPSGGIWFGSKGSWFDWIFSEAAGEGCYSKDMAITSNDIPHIVYFHPKEIWHTFFDIHSQQWIAERLYGFDNTYGFGVCIDISSDNRIMIGSRNIHNQILVSVQEEGWNYLPVINPGTTVFGLDCSFTADGLPAVAYLTSQGLYYAVYINEIIGWTETLAVPAQIVSPPFGISLSHSSADIPGIAYVDDESIMYATNVAGGWTTVQVDEYGHFVDLIFDHNDNPLIAYTGLDECSGKAAIKLAGIGLEPFNIADLNNDKTVNFGDFAIIANNWMAILSEPDMTIGDFDQNAIIDSLDLRRLGCNWLWQGGQ